MAFVSYKCTDTIEDYEERKTLPCPFSENDRSIVKGSFGIFFANPCQSPPKAFVHNGSMMVLWGFWGFMMVL